MDTSYEMSTAGDSVQVTVIAEARNIGQSAVQSCGCFSFWEAGFGLGPEQWGDMPLGGPPNWYKGPVLKVAPVECPSAVFECQATTITPGGAIDRTMSFFFRPATFATKTGELHIRCFYFSGTDGMAWEDTEHVDMGTIAVPLRTLGTIGRYRH